MMKKSTVIGSIFLIVSGLLYEFDKYLSYYKWASHILAINGNGSYNAIPDKVMISDNPFCTLFLILGIGLYSISIYNYKKTRR